MVLVLKKFALLLCAVAVLLSTTFVPTIASASTINTELASNPTATIAEIEKIGLPMSDEMAGEMRGGIGLADVLLALGTIAGIIEHYGTRLLNDPRVINGLTSLKNWAANWKGNIPDVAQVLSNGSVIVHTVAGWVPLENSTTPMMITR